MIMFPVITIEIVLFGYCNIYRNLLVGQDPAPGPLNEDMKENI